MAQPITARSGKMRVMLGVAGTDPGPTAVTSLSNANPAVVTVGAGAIANFQNGMSVNIAGATGTGMTVANGTHTISGVNTGAGTFVLTGVDTSTGAAPLTSGVTADAPALIAYTAPCGFTTKSLVMTKNLTEVSIPDCDDPDAPLWIGRDTASLTSQITGEGVAAAESVPAWNEAWANVESVPVRVEIEFSTGLKVFEGMYQVESLTFGAEQGGRVTLNVSMQSDGEIAHTWTASP